MSRFNMDYDKNDAVIDEVNRLQKSGVYFGTIDKAVIVESKTTDAWGVEITFTTDAGELAKSTIWVANKDGLHTYTNKKSGKEEKLPGYKLFVSIFAILGIEKIIAVTNQTTNVSGYTQLTGKKIGFAIQREEKENTAPNATRPTYWANNIVNVFHPQTKKSWAEMLGNKEAVAHLKVYYDKLLDENSKPAAADHQNTAAVAGMAESEMPF